MAERTGDSGRREDSEVVVRVVPTREEQIGIQWREMWSAMGREGLGALLVFAWCWLVLALGALVTVRGWRAVRASELSIPRFAGWVPDSPWWVVTIIAVVLVLSVGLAALLRDVTPTGFWVCAGVASVAAVLLLGLLARDLPAQLGLPGYWVIFSAMIALAGWLLSRQVSKRWLRLFVGAAVVLAALLLVAIGRNAQVAESRTVGESEALRLLAAESTENATADVRTSLLSLLCEEGDLVSRCRNAVGSVVPPLLLDARAAPLKCLPGWTVAAVDEWVDAASSDRKVAVLSALTQCEINAEAVARLEVEALQAAEATGEEGSTSGGASGDTTTASEPVEGGADPDDVSGELSAAREALEAQRAVVREELEVQRSEVRLLDSIERGADGILAWLSGPSDLEQFRFSGVVWLVILGGALLWYRRLEIRAGAHRLGPVDLQFERELGAGSKKNEEPGDGAEDGSAGEGPGGSPKTSEVVATPGEAIFKEAVVRNVPEPGAVPGAHALAPVGDLVASSDTPHRFLISGIVDAVQMILATDSGYTVVYNAHDSRDGSVVFVRLRDSRTGQHVASMTFGDQHLEAASRLAGYWVAGWIISRSHFVPEWARWSEHDARAFHSLHWVQGDDLPLRLRGAVDPTAVDGASVNSLILAQRAYSYEIRPAEGGGPRLFNSLEDFARAVHRQPRYPVARYRRSAALSALMEDGVVLSEVAELGENGEVPVDSRLRYLFGDMILGLTGGSEELDDWLRELRTTGRFPRAMRRAMLLRITQWTAENRAAIRWGTLARLRRSERYFWKEFSVGELKEDWVHLVDTGLCITVERLRDVAVIDEEDDARVTGLQARIEERALAADSHWQISYNLACLHALRARGAARSPEAHAPGTDDGLTPYERERAAACRWLERCLDRPYSGQLVREWVDNDPDLDPLEGHPDFDRWRARVPRMPVVIRLGDVGTPVQDLQEKLRRAGETTLVVDGQYGVHTKAAVERVQRQRGLAVDGVAGPKTLAVLDGIRPAPAPVPPVPWRQRLAAQIRARRRKRRGPAEERLAADPHASEPASVE